MSHPPLLAVAHGSRNPAAADVVRKLARQVGRLAPMLDVRVAFLGHADPSLPAQLDAAGSGAVVVPLLLSSGYHVSTDIASAARSAGARVAAPLGPDQLLLTALTARLAEAGVPAGTPVVLAAAGSSDPAAAADVEKQAVLLSAELDVPVLAGYLSAARPTVAEAVRQLRKQTGGQIALACYLLAPGRFAEQLRDYGADWVTGPLGGHPAVAGLVIDRYRTAAKAAS
jgi:sirohydrochlorin ferrochelatase